MKHDTREIRIGAMALYSSRLWVVAFVAALLVAGWILVSNTSLESTPQPGDVPTSAAESDEAGMRPAEQAYPESMPPAGKDLFLTAPQVRWCIYESARLAGMEAFIEGDAETKVYNTHARKFNQRCGAFRFESDTMESVMAELNTEGRRLEAEGVERLLALRKSRPSRSGTQAR